MDKNKVKKLKRILQKLDKLETSTLSDSEVELGSLATKLLDSQMEEYVKKAKETASFKALERVSLELAKLKKEINFAPLIEEIDKLEEAVDEKYAELNNTLEEKISALSSELDNVKAFNITGALQSLNDIENFLDKKNAKGLTAFANKLRSDFDGMADNLRKSREEIKSLKSLTVDVGEMSSSMSSLMKSLQDTRTEFLQKLSQGGGNANRQINVNSSVMSSKYNDINFLQGNGIAWTVSDDNTLKRVNIQASIIAATGGGGTPGGSDTQVQFNDSGSFAGDPAFTWSSSVLTVGQPGSVKGAIDLAGSSSQTVRLSVPSVAGAWEMTLPGDSGTAGQYLLTDGNGITQWASVVSGSVSFGTDNQIPFTNAGGTDFDYSSNFTFDGTSFEHWIGDSTNFYASSGAGDATTTGSNNVGIGLDALGAMTVGTQNVAVGNYAMSSTTTTSGTTQNVAIGYSALGNANGAGQNVVIGVQAGLRITTQDNNVMIGKDSNLGAAIGSAGSNNIFIGYQSGYDETGSNTLIIDNQDRGSEALGRTNSLIYGIMAAAVADQDFRVNADLGVNTTPSALIHGVKTTEQLRLGYDASNYLSATVASTGDTTLSLTGTTPEFTFSQSVNMGNDALIHRDVNAGLTASTTQTQGQGALTAEINEVATVANPSDTVTLPTAVAGLKIVIINNGANAMKIFPASGDNLGAGLNTAMTTDLAAGDMITFVAYDATNWRGVRGTFVT